MMKFEDVVKELEKDEKWYIVENEDMVKNVFRELAFFTKWEDAFDFVTTEPVYKNERYIISTIYTSDIDDEAIEELLENMEESKKELTDKDKEKLSKSCDDLYDSFYTKPIEHLSSMSDKEFANFIYGKRYLVKYMYDGIVFDYNLFGVKGEVLFNVFDIGNFLSEFSNVSKDNNDVDYLISIVKNNEEKVIKYVLGLRKDYIIKDIEKAGK